MITLQNLIDFAQKNNIDPNKCTILLRGVCGNGDIEYDYFDKFFKEDNVEALNSNDEFEKVETAISLEQLWIPDFMGY